MAVGVGVDVFGVRHSAHQAEGGDQVAVDGAQAGVIIAASRNGERREDSTTLRDVHRRLAVLADVGENDFVLGKRLSQRDSRRRGRIFPADRKTACRPVDRAGATVPRERFS